MGSHLRAALIGALLGMSGFGCGGPDRPNLILITLDTTRADHLGSYGYAVETSPVLDALAAGGVRFEAATAQSATTPVSCASQLTGLYPYHHGLRSMHGHRKNRLPAEVPTIQEELGRLGYRTGAFVSAFPASSHYGFARGFDHFDEGFLERGRALIRSDGIVWTGDSQRNAAETNEAALAWVREQSAERFFLWLHYFDPHDPQSKPPDSFVAPFLRAEKEVDRDEYLRSIYDAEIAFVDQQIGALVETLEELDLREHTVLVITADHGEGLGDHGWWGHGILYQEQIRVPLIVNGPGVQAGKVVHAPVEHVDLFPTLLSLAGGASQAVDGIDLLPVLQGSSLPRARTETYSEVHNVRAFRESAEVRERGEMYSLTRDGLKLIHFPRNPALDELYDLTTDALETRNRITSDRERANVLLARLQEREAIDDYLPDPNTLSVSERERLRELGYLEPEPERTERTER
jgi:arylsulfatase A-like enzyme